jgi:hypothetical protein
VFGNYFCSSKHARPVSQAVRYIKQPLNFLMQCSIARNLAKLSIGLRQLVATAFSQLASDLQQAIEFASKK